MFAASASTYRHTPYCVICGAGFAELSPRSAWLLPAIAPAAGGASTEARRRRFNPPSIPRCLRLASRRAVAAQRCRGPLRPPSLVAEVPSPRRTTGPGRKARHNDPVAAGVAGPRGAGEVNGLRSVRVRLSVVLPASKSTHSTLSAADTGWSHRRSDHADRRR